MIAKETTINNSSNNKAIKGKHMAFKNEENLVTT